MLTELTGLPSPTTGGTRSFLALLAGDVRLSLYYHPFTPPILGLLAVTIGQLLTQGRCANWMAKAWVLLLALGWIVKLASPPATW